ncbi:MAG: nucleotidyltransferase domain-containing protein [Gallionella sp.]|jgi:type I restriction enzyme S subunit|nr:nucleotidyltransferase domain-containing protein [Gallionella sp.]
MTSQKAAAIDLVPAELEIVRRILARHVPQYEVWAFGSRVSWTAKKYSDLDLAVITDKPLDWSVSAALAEAFDQSDLTIKVDVVDWAATSEAFREIIGSNSVIIQLKQASTVSASIQEN